ncbi:matrixin family metalloprotease [Patescibacteria group bacterium]|nr:matrixin family metalloprotease [Patescibacteria group bacterium]
MKKIIVLLLLAAAVLFNKQILGYANNILYLSACDTPIEYRLGTVDPRFNITDDQFLLDIKEAADIWNKAENKTLFEFNKKADLTISLVFDQRQAIDNKIGSLENQIQSGKDSINPEIREYKQLSSDFKQKLNSFNAEVNMWNAKGGAPPDAYNRLKTEQQDLKNEADKLNQLADRLNISTNQYNQKINELQSTINTFNNALSLKPEEGLYDPANDTIVIYFDTNHDELIHTLAHELGHALGMQHEQDPKAIMYPYTTKTTTASMADIAQLNKICTKRNIFQFSLEKFPLLLKKYSPFYKGR